MKNVLMQGEKHLYITLIFLLLGSICGLSQVRNTELYINFRANETCIDAKYKNNSETIASLAHLLKQIQQDSTISIEHIFFSGTASPEGSYEINRQMSQGRLASLERFIRNQIDIPDSIINRSTDSICWEHLALMVKDSDIPHKDEILEIINASQEIVKYYNRTIDKRVLRLMALGNGRVWREMKRSFFTKMRNAGVVVIVTKKTPLPIVKTALKSNTHAVKLTDTKSSAPNIASLYRYYVTDSKEEHINNLHVKTNLLGLGLGIANAAVETDLCKHLSFNLHGYYSAWNYFTSSIKFRAFALQPEVRYWFSNKNICNDGLFTGVHFGIAWYNIAVKGEYRYQDHNGNSPALGGGLTLGYRLPISKNSRWKAEFSLGAGIYNLQYDKFRNYGNRLLVSTHEHTYIGLDQATVSFTYTFELNRKGGSR